MHKLVKIGLVIVIILVIIFAIFAALFVLDIVAYTATGSQILTPDGTAVGKALVLYDPGLSGTASKVATKVAEDLQAQNYTVHLLGIKNADASYTTGFDIVVVGGPIYAGSPTASVKDAVNNLHPDVGSVVGVFGSGQGATSAEDIAQIKAAIPALGSSGSLSSAVVVKIGESEDLDARAQDFVNQLVSN
jgi:flavodoxin